MMTRTPGTHPAHAPARRPAWRRAVRRAATALGDLHREHEYAWECLWRASRVPADQPGPLTWTPSLDGPRLAGTWLPAPDDIA